MKRAIIAAVASLLATGAAFAASPPCKDAGSTAAKPVLYYTADPAVLDGLEVALKLGLEPATFPSQDIAKQKDACIRRSFDAAGGTWTLYGDDHDTSPRWAVASNTNTIVYLAYLPPADQAHLWAEADRHHSTNEKFVKFSSMMLALVAADGDKRRVFGFYDSLPDDARLTEAMQLALEGRTPAILGFDVKTGDADEDRMLAPLTVMVVGTKGKVDPADQAVPDGVAFTTSADATAKARHSGLVCPPTLASFNRSTVFTTGAADGDQETGCRYVSELAHLAIVTSRAAPGASSKDAMMQMIAGPVASSNAHQVPAPQTQDLQTGVEEFAVAFVDPDGARQAVWSMKRPDGWFVEVYALYGQGGEAAVAEAVNGLMTASKAP
jgi:hypothetical protein